MKTRHKVFFVIIMIVSAYGAGFIMGRYGHKKTRKSRTSNTLAIGTKDIKENKQEAKINKLAA
jgi:hypothetical protein